MYIRTNWLRMRKEVAQYVATCSFCQKAKIKHQQECYNPLIYLNGNGIL